MDKCKLRTFSVRNKNGRVTDKLVTSSEFGRWMMSYFSPNVYQELLFTNDKEGPTYHPGNKIGTWFNKQGNSFISKKYYSIYIPTDTETYARLKEKGIVQSKDISTNCKAAGNKKVVRCFTLDQIQLFLDSFVNFGEAPNHIIKVKEHLSKNINIYTTYDDYKHYICLYPSRKVNLIEQKQICKKQMTIEQVEKELGYSIAIVSNKEETK